MSSSNTIHPDHYAGEMKCIDVARWMGFNTGNVVKYLWRCGRKGDPAEDLSKALDYVNFEIEQVRVGFIRRGPNEHFMSLAIEGEEEVPSNLRRAYTAICAYEFGKSGGMQNLLYARGKLEDLVGG